MLDHFDQHTWITRYSLEWETTYSQYVNSFYWAVQTLSMIGYGDIVPKTNKELTMTVFWLFIGVLVYSYTLCTSFTYFLYHLKATLKKHLETISKKLTFTVDIPEEA